MTSSTKIKEIIARPLETIGISDSIQSAAIRMRDMDISSILVVDKEGEPCGIITERDLVRKMCVNDVISTSEIEIHEMMSSSLLVTIDSNASPSEAADLMLKNKVRHLLVVDRRNKLDSNNHNNVSKPIGIITPLDFTKYRGNIVVDNDSVEKILEFYRD